MKKTFDPVKKTKPPVINNKTGGFVINKVYSFSSVRAEEKTFKNSNKKTVVYARFKNGDYGLPSKNAKYILDIFEKRPAEMEKLMTGDGYSLEQPMRIYLKKMDKSDPNFWRAEWVNEESYDGDVPLNYEEEFIGNKNSSDDDEEDVDEVDHPVQPEPLRTSKEEKPPSRKRKNQQLKKMNNKKRIFMIDSDESS